LRCVSLLALPEVQDVTLIIFDANSLVPHGVSCTVLHERHTSSSQYVGGFGDASVSKYRWK
jgi:hypothetical protein